MYQQLWGHKVEEKLYLGVREQKKVEYHCSKRSDIKHKSSLFYTHGISLKACLHQEKLITLRLSNPVPSLLTCPHAFHPLIS
jgi:hypothetical protein